MTSALMTENTEIKTKIKNLEEKNRQMSTIIKSSMNPDSKIS
jgi:hypothetical protein